MALTQLMTTQDTHRFTSLHKHEFFKVFEIFCKRVQNEKKQFFISSIRSDHEIEFENVEFKSFYEKNGIFLNFSSPRTPQQNRVVERKNKTLQEMARTYYELWRGIRPNISYFHPFGCEYFILNIRDRLTKSDSKLLQCSTQ